MKKLIIYIICTAFLATCLLGCGKSNTKTTDANGIKIFLSLSAQDTFRNALVKKAQETAKENGATLDVVDEGGSMEAQIEDIKEAVAQNYDAIICGLVDKDIALQIEALSEDIPIVFFNNCPDEKNLESKKYVYVGSDEISGQYQAEYILSNMAAESELNIAVFKGQKGHPATNQRINTLKNTLKNSGKTVNYVFEDYANWDADTAENMFNVFLKTNQKCNVAVCQNDEMALGIIRACEKAGLKDIIVLGIDATENGCAAIESGTMDFTVYQPADGQGQRAVETAIALAKGNSIKQIEGASEDEKYVWVPFEKVDSSNVQNYK